MRRQRGRPIRPLAENRLRTSPPRWRRRPGQIPPFGAAQEPSPDWLRRKLEALGQSSINNVVDATNYVLLETSKTLSNDPSIESSDKLEAFQLTVINATTSKPITKAVGSSEA